MTTLQSEQEPLDLRIVQEITSIAPEKWKSVRMEASREPGAGGAETLRVTITSPEGHRDIVIPTDKLLLAVRELSLVFHRYKHPWQAVRYYAEQLAGGSWSFRAEYKYDPA